MHRHDPQRRQAAARLRRHKSSQTEAAQEQAPARTSYCDSLDAKPWPRPCVWPAGVFVTQWACNVTGGREHEVARTLCLAAAEA